ncbi:AraC family transcriptional regulator [Rhizobium sp. Leaf383]|uniref:AraC family transcriptional regulator n=1 Tax=Rhizobium sp. Leaf383 TaxID=1736357 RepID=UPI000715557F|nr:AraC family transcriptional regulator [Rhizobium sp. Leaf383]KQS76409.1 hypothetical protein ASG58_11330 [Rhizobium sp. Leaf383]
MNHDPLTDVLRLTRAEGVLSTGLRATGAFAVRVQMKDGMKFNALTRGSCFLDVAGTTFQLAQGDCFLLTRPQEFVIGNDRTLEPLSADRVFATARSGFAELNNGGPAVEFVGGRMTSDVSMDLLTSALPPVLIMRGDTADGRWVAGLLARLRKELVEERPGAEVIAERIMHMVFVQMIRSDAWTDQATGWIAALSDPRISRALSAIHRDPGHAWRVESLASASGLSRSQFAARFTRQVGEAPLEYLTRWRMALARNALLEGRTSIARIASDVGYGSEAAFGAAYKRVYGISPRRHVGSPQAI